MARNLIIMCGVPASGKSYFANYMVENKDKFFDKKAKVTYVSRDKVRFSIINEQDSYFAKEDEVYKEFIKQIRKGFPRDRKQALNKEYYVIADATHLNRFSREKLINSIGKNNIDYIIAVNIITPLETCIERNSKREEKTQVPEFSLKRMYRDFSPATKEEGFEKIIIVENNKVKVG